jgi:hypothetical protein
MFGDIEKIEDLDSMGIYPVKCIFELLQMSKKLDLDDRAVFEFADAGLAMLDELSECIERLSDKYKAAEKPENRRSQINAGKPHEKRIKYHD